MNTVKTPIAKANVCVYVWLKIENMEGFIFICLLIFAIISAIVGSNRQIGSLAGFFLGLFLGVIGLVIVLCSDKTQQYIPPARNNGISIPDQLKKYKELLDSGAITENEYNAQKGKLLNQ